jgi:hypothetical protein
MATYVLGTRCLLDIAKKDGNKAQLWYEGLAAQGVHFGDVCISAFSVALIRFLFDDHPPVTPGDRQLQVNNRLIDQFKTADAVLGCSQDAVYYWAENLGEGLEYDQPPPSRKIGSEALVLATVATAPRSAQYRLVDRLQSIHSQLIISVFDPY